MRSELTTAPIVVRLFCSAIGPSSVSRAVRTWPRVPAVGSVVLPVGGAGGEAPADAAGDPDGDGEPDGDADGAGGGAGRRTRAGASPMRSTRIGEALAPGDAAGARRAAGTWRTARARRRARLRQVRDLHGLDVDEARAGLDRGGFQPLRLEHGLDLVGRDVRVLEADLPRRATGVVDRELQARVGERGEEDEEQARDGDDQRDEIEPAPLPDDVKHARAPRAEPRG